MARNIEITNKIVLIAMTTLSLIGLVTSPVAASPIPREAYTVTPGQIQKQFNEPLAAPTSEDVLPSPAEAEIPKAIQEKLAKKQFVLKDLQIEGATIYSADQLKSTYEDMIGKTISLLDAQMITKRITDLYHNDGYVLSQAVVPQQDISNGVLKIRVIEGFVDGIVLQGDTLSDGEKSVLQSYADNILKMRPARTKDMERYLLLMNDLPGATVHGLLRPSPTQFGAADLILNVKNKEFEGAYTFDNRGSKFVGPWQHTATLAGNSLLGMYDRTQVRMFTTSPHTSQLFGVEVQHEQVLDSEGTKLILAATHTHTEPGDTLSSLDLVGTSNLFEAKVTHPFIRLRQQNLVGFATFDYHDSKNNIFKTADFTNDHLRVARLGGNYNYVDTLRGNNFVNLQLSRGLNIFDATSTGTDRSNANGKSNFTKFNLDASRLQGLPENFSVLAAMSGQYAFDPLLVDEQFSVGGADYGRAYDPAQLLGDHGIAGKLELRYDGAVNKSYFKSYQLFTFTDIGHTWVIDGPVGSDNRTTISSFGAGVRLNLTDNFSGNVEADMPILHPTSDQANYRHDPRLFMGVSAKF